jgi:hypothetical protein
MVRSIRISAFCILALASSVCSAQGTQTQIPTLQVCNQTLVCRECNSGD